MRHPQVAAGGVGLALQLWAGASAVIWPNEKWLAWMFLCIGLAIFIGSLTWWFFASFRLQLPFRARVVEAKAVEAKPSGFVLYRNDKVLSLSEAAQIAYDELDGTMWRMAADKWHGSPEERLDFMATYIIHNAPIEGCSPPSKIRKHIPQDEFKSGVVKGGGRSFQRHYDNQDTYVDLAVREEDFRDALKRMRLGE